MKKAPLSRPDPAVIEAEFHRLSYWHRFRAALRSTLCAFTTTAALAVLAAALWFPVLQVSSDVLAPELQKGDLVLCRRTDQVQAGDLVACYEGNTLLLRRCVSVSEDRIELLEPEGTALFTSREQVLGRVLLRLWPFFKERGS